MVKDVIAELGKNRPVGRNARKTFVEVDAFYGKRIIGYA